MTDIELKTHKSILQLLTECAANSALLATCVSLEIQLQRCGPDVMALLNVAKNSLTVIEDKLDCALELLQTEEDAQ